MSEDLALRLEHAKIIAQEAGALALDYFYNQNRLVVEQKRSESDLVSQADREVEALIRQALAKAFPEDGVIGEEEGHRPGASEFTWVIDPIDGTAPYLSGLPTWCVSIGLMENTKPVLGVINAPVLGEFFEGGRGLGARLNEVPIAVVDGGVRARIVGLGMNDRISVERACELIARFQSANVNWARFGSGALMIAYVAAGRLSGYAEPKMSIWDCCSGYALVEEAGGRALEFPSGAAMMLPARVLAASAKAYEELLLLSQ